MQGATIRRDEHSGAVVVARIMRGGAADRSGECISAGLAEVLAVVPQPVPFGHSPPFPLLSTHLFGMCFAFWKWGWNSLLLPKLCRKFSCLEISQAWSKHAMTLNEQVELMGSEAGLYCSSMSVNYVMF